MGRNLKDVVKKEIIFSGLYVIDRYDKIRSVEIDGPDEWIYPDEVTNISGKRKVVFNASDLSNNQILDIFGDSTITIKWIVPGKEEVTKLLKFKDYINFLN
jgi:hypothetical protein